MPSQASDLSTQVLRRLPGAQIDTNNLVSFRSALVKEDVPDFTFRCGDRAWKVHSHLFARHSKPFKAIFQEGATKEWTSPDDAVTTAHLILWIYTGGYGDLTELADTFDKEPLEIDIDLVMRHGRILPTRADGTPGVLSEEDELFMPQKPTWIPDNLDAKMYLVGARYEIEDLREQAVKMIVGALEADESSVLPLLIDVLGGAGEKADKIKNEGDGEPESRQGVDIDVQLLEAPLRSPNSEKLVTPPATPASPSFSVSPSVSPPPHTLSQISDPDLWELLVEGVADRFGDYQNDPKFRTVLNSNLQFFWDMITRLQEKYSETQQVVSDQKATILKLDAADLKKSTKGKGGKKKKEKEVK